jgi:hypothetical protein
MLNTWIKSEIHATDGTRKKVLTLHGDKLCGKMKDHNASYFMILLSRLCSETLKIRGKKDPYKVMNSAEITEFSTLAYVGLLKHIAL